jgi:hypothetical protein
LGRIIHTTNPTRQRTATLKRMASAIREHSDSSAQGKEAPELAVFLISQLREIRESVDRTAEAWEKRDYWNKADAFRRQWKWVEILLPGLQESVKAGNLPDLQARIRELEQKVNSPKTP